MNSKVVNDLNLVEVRKRITEHRTRVVHDCVPPDNFKITYAKLEDGIWSINVEYHSVSDPKGWLIPSLYVINAKTGRIREFKTGCYLE